MRIRSAVAFGAILVVCVAGAFQQSPIVICAGSAALVLVTLSQHQAHYGRYSSQGNIRAQSMLLLGSTLNAATAMTIAFALGRVIGWLWGI